MPCQGRFDLPPARRGDTWYGVNSFRVRIGGESPEASLSFVRIKIVNPASKAVALTLDSDTEEGSGGITITNAADWIFTIDKIDRITLDPLTYEYDLETTDFNDDRQTYIAGKWVVRADITT